MRKIAGEQKIRIKSSRRIRNVIAATIMLTRNVILLKYVYYSTVWLNHTDELSNKIEIEMSVRGDAFYSI